MPRKIVTIHSRVTPQEKEALMFIARLEGRSESEMLRALIQEGIERRRLDFETIARLCSKPDSRC